MPINLNFHVRQGTYGVTANTNFNFGTDGLATCVGIIVQLNNGQNFCGHMDHSYEPNRLQEVQFKNAVNALLIGTIPVANATAVFYCTPGGGMAARYTVEEILNVFPGAQNAGNRSCIYIDAQGVQSTDQNANLGQLVYNGAFGV